MVNTDHTLFDITSLLCKSKLHRREDITNMITVIRNQGNGTRIRTEYELDSEEMAEAATVSKDCCTITTQHIQEHIHSGIPPTVRNLLCALQDRDGDVSYCCRCGCRFDSKLWQGYVESSYVMQKIGLRPIYTCPDCVTEALEAAQ